MSALVGWKSEDAILEAVAVGSVDVQGYDGAGEGAT